MKLWWKSKVEVKPMLLVLLALRASRKCRLSSVFPIFFCLWWIFKWCWWCSCGCSMFLYVVTGLAKSISASAAAFTLEVDGKIHPLGCDVQDCFLVQLAPDSTANIAAANWAQASPKPGTHEQCAANTGPSFSTANHGLRGSSFRLWECLTWNIKILVVTSYARMTPSSGRKDFEFLKIYAVQGKCVNYFLAF